jgi:hypothetical protein
MENQIGVSQINIIATVDGLKYRVHLVRMHITGYSPKQFEDNHGNLWYSSEISNLEHIK